MSEYEQPETISNKEAFTIIGLLLGRCLGSLSIFLVPLAIIYLMVVAGVGGASCSIEGDWMPPTGLPPCPELSALAPNTSP